MAESGLAGDWRSNDEYHFTRAQVGLEVQLDIATYPWVGDVASAVWNEYFFPASGGASSVSKAMTARYDIRQAASDSLQLRYDIRQAQADSVQFQYDIVSDNISVGKELQLRYHMRIIARHLVELRYAIERQQAVIGSGLAGTDGISAEAYAGLADIIGSAMPISSNVHAAGAGYSGAITGTPTMKEDAIL